MKKLIMKTRDLCSGPKPAGDWDEYDFTPQPDLTAYELALILKRFIAADGSAVSLAMPMYIRKDDPASDVIRHFTKRNAMAAPAPPD
jgi:hypothetical protein